MIARCLGHGVRAASTRRGLVSMLWATTLALGLLATIPAWAWWRSGFARSPAGDALLDGFNLATYFDLVHYDRSPVTSLLVVNVAALVAAALVVGALVFGGTIEILRATDGRTFMHRFFRGAGHFFGRNLRLAVYTGVAALVVTGLAAAALAPLLAPLDASAWEPGWAVAAAVRLALVGAVALYFFLVLDYARVRVAIDDTRRVLVTWIASFGFVLRHLIGTYAIVVACGACGAVLLALYLGYCRVAPARTGISILALAAVQQAAMWLRAAVRVAEVAAEVEYFEITAAAAHTARAAESLSPDSAPPARRHATPRASVPGAGAAEPEARQGESSQPR